VLQQAGIIPSPPTATANCTSNDNESDSENNTSDTSSDADQNSDKDKEEQNIEASKNIKDNNITNDQNTAVGNSGILLLDATVAEQQIEYPTDLKLLNESREQLETMIAQVCKAGKLHQPRM